MIRHILEGIENGTPCTHESNCAKENYVSYNCLSIVRHGRLEAICSELSNAAIVALQGTRSRQLTNPLSSSVVGKFNVYQAGYSNVSNKHSGVAILVNMKHANRKHIHSYAYPEDRTGEFRGDAWQ